MELLFPRSVFACAKDFSGSDDFYLFELRPDIIPKWNQVHFSAGDEYSKAVISQSLKTLIIITADPPVPDFWYISTNRGKDWDSFTPPHVFRTFLPITETKIYGATTDKLYITTDTTATWDELGTFKTGVVTGSPIQILLFPTRTNLQERFVIIHDEGDSYHSTDNGNTWTTISTGLDSIKKVIVLGNKIVAFRDGVSQCSISNDRGLTWSAPIPIIAGKVFQDVTFPPTAKNTIIAACDDQIAVSYDFGLTWGEGAITDGGHILHSIAYDSGYDILGCNEDNGFFYKMKNYGETIDVYQFNDDANIKPIALLEIPPQYGNLFSSKITTERTETSTITTQIKSSGVITGTIL